MVDKIESDKIESNTIDSDKIESVFNLPISYLHDKHPLAEHIKTDLELIVKEGENSTSLYDTVFQPTTLYGKQTTVLWSQYYTANKAFIKDSQRLIKKINKERAQIIQDNDKQLRVQAIWQEIKSETGFIEKYHYIDYKRFKELNNSSQFLQLLSLYNMTSPLLSLSIPIFFLVFPFILIKLQGIPISISKYFEILKMLFKQHQLGQIFALGSASWDKVIYILASVGFYLLQVYQNVMSCIKYYHNMKKIHSQLFTIKDYAQDTLKNIEVLQSIGGGLKTYQPFFADIMEHKAVLEHIVREFGQVVPNGFSLKKVKQIGHVMKCFYQLYNNDDYHNTLEYSFGLNGYLDNLLGLGQRYKKKEVGCCKIIREKKIIRERNNKYKPTNFKDAYFPSLVDATPVKNSYALDKHMLITGPNAAGKTTLLKTTIFNIIFSQQTGFGFYKSANINLYDYIHCYINIPDTSARDSLFQAEARRCKDILTSISETSISETSISETSISETSISETSISNTTSEKLSSPYINEICKDKTHLCVFDELYSGTNPYEAIGSAYAFLSYLNKFDNVNFVLTTHYLDLCKRLEETQKGINNYHMEVLTTGDDFNYTYKMKRDISTIKGGVKVLRDLDYPKEIIDVANLLVKG